jgi:hypothetical protein
MTSLKSIVRAKKVEKVLPGRAITILAPTGLHQIFSKLSAK